MHVVAASYAILALMCTASRDLVSFQDESGNMDFEELPEAMPTEKSS